VRRAGFGWLLVLLALAAAAPAAERPASLKRQREALRDKIDAAKRDLAKSEHSHSSVVDQLKEVETAISATNRQLLELAGQQSALNEQLRELNHHRSELLASSRLRQEQLARLLRHKAMADDSNPARQLLSGEDPNQAAFDHHLLTLLSRAEANLIGDLRQEAAEQARLAGVAQAKATELEKVEAAVRESRADLQAKQRARQHLLARSQAEIKTRRSEIGALERDDRQLATLIANLPAKRPARPVARPQPSAPGATVKSAAPPPGTGGAFAALKGTLPAPVSGRISGHFGTPRPEGGAIWKGLFFRVAEGAEVKSVAAGEIVYADWLRGFGNLMVIDHGDGFLSVYGNNQSLLKQVGTPVRGGEVVATAGTSGGNPESGLYFELRYQGRSFDPRAWLRPQR
jgi:murein hydrolase activator